MKVSRTYTMGARADAVVATRERIVDVATRLFFEHAFEDVTLAAIAKAAGRVAPDRAQPLRVEGGRRARRRRGASDGRRPTPATAPSPATCAGAVHVLVGDYERIGDANARWAVTAERLGTLAPLLDDARAGHQEWLAPHVRRPPAGGSTPPAGGPSTPCTRRPTSTRGSCCAATSASAGPRPRRPSSSSSRAILDTTTREARMTTMNTYLVALVDGGGTVPPELAAVRRLVERGHDVTVLAEDSMEADVRAPRAPRSDGGSRHRTAPTAVPSTTRTGTGSARTRCSCSTGCSSASSSARRRRYAADVDRGDRRAPSRPRAVLAVRLRGDGRRRGGRHPVRRADAEHLPAADAGDDADRASASARPRGPLGRARDRLMLGRDAAGVGQGPRPAQRRARRARAGARCGTSWTRPTRARRQLVMTSPDFDFPGRAAGQRPLRRPGARRPDVGGAAQPWTPPPGDEPLVLVALSSTFQDHQGDACSGSSTPSATLPVRAVVTTGPALDPAAITAPGQRHRASPPHRTARCSPMPRWSSPTAATARWSRRSPPACRSSCCPTAATRPTTPSG